MAKKKKLFTYEFVDGKKTFQSSNIVKCTQTGEKIKMYHKQLYKLIKNKYNMALTNRSDLNQLEKNQRLSFLSDCYTKRYDGNIFKVLKEAELI
jgi:hypothetical protein